MSYIVDATVALTLVSRAAALSAIPPHPQIPQMPMRPGSTRSCTDRKSTAAWKSSVLMSGEATYRGWPALSPVKEGSKAMVRNPRSASVWAYRPEHCSFTAPNGPEMAIAGSLSDASFGTYRSAARVIP